MSISTTTPSPNLSGMELSVDGAVLPLITAPDGKRTGKYAANEVALHEINDSGFFEDDIGQGTTNVIDVGEPTSGTYTLTLAAGSVARYNLSIDIIDMTGTPEPRLQASGSIQQGSHKIYLLSVAIDGQSSSSISSLR